MLRKRAAKAAEVPMVALVIEADDPLDNRITFGRSSAGTVRILIDAERDPIYVARDFKLDRDHWLVPGMQVPVMVDPSHPETFEIRWDQIPSMVQRAASNDPTLADPVGTKKKTQQVLLASGAVGPAGPYRPNTRSVTSSSRPRPRRPRTTTHVPTTGKSRSSAPPGSLRPPARCARSSCLPPARRPCERKEGPPTERVGRAAGHRSGSATAHTTSCSR